MLSRRGYALKGLIGVFASTNSLLASNGTLDIPMLPRGETHDGNAISMTSLDVLASRRIANPFVGKGMVLKVQRSGWRLDSLDGYLNG